MDLLADFLARFHRYEHNALGQRAQYLVKLCVLSVDDQLLLVHGLERGRDVVVVEDEDSEADAEERDDNERVELHLEVLVVLYDDGRVGEHPAHDLGRQRFADEPADHVGAAHVDTTAQNLKLLLEDWQDWPFEQEGHREDDWVEPSGPLERFFEQN